MCDDKVDDDSFGIRKTKEGFRCDVQALGMTISIPLDYHDFWRIRQKINALLRAPDCSARILYGNVPKWFNDEMSSRPREQRESFNHPPCEVIHTPHEWIDGEESGRMYGAWRPVKPEDSQ